jgi:hypothetical protein
MRPHALMSVVAAPGLGDEYPWVTWKAAGMPFGTSVLAPATGSSRSSLGPRRRGGAWGGLPVVSVWSDVPRSRYRRPVAAVGIQDGGRKWCIYPELNRKRRTSRWYWSGVSAPLSPPSGRPLRRQWDARRSPEPFRCRYPVWRSGRGRREPAAFCSCLELRARKGSQLARGGQVAPRSSRTSSKSTAAASLG